MSTMIMLLSERRSPAATAATAACKSSGNRSFNCLMTPVWAYNGSMSRYRLYPTPEQEVLLLEAIRELSADGAAVTKYRVTKELPVGESRADRLLAAWHAERPSLSVAR